MQKNTQTFSIALVKIGDNVGVHNMLSFGLGRVETKNTLKMSVKANELRIGNIIKDKNGDYLTVFGVNQTHVFDNDKFIDGIPLDWCRDVELTDELLLNIGFRFDYDGGYFSEYKKEYWLTITSDSNGYLFWQNSYGGRHFKSLHHLQNLYYSLTKEELLVNF